MIVGRYTIQFVSDKKYGFVTMDGFGMAGISNCVNTSSNARCLSCIICNLCIHVILNPDYTLFICVEKQEYNLSVIHVTTLMSVVTSRRCEMHCNVWEHYNLVTCYNRGFQFCDISKFHRELQRL